MKKMVAVLLLVFCSTAYAWNPFEGLIKAKVADEVNAVKAQVAGDINGVRADIQKLADVQVKLSARITAQAAAIAGVGNQVSNIQARDVNQNSGNTNDSALMKALFEASTNGFTYVIGLLMAYIVRLSYQRTKLEGRLMDYINKQEEGQAKYIRMLEAVANRALDGVIKKQEASK